MDKELNDYKTCELVEELSKREGVEMLIADPDVNLKVELEWPAIILKVID